MIDDTQLLRFFIEPSTPTQRQYEALRAYFIDQLSQQQIADRFGYTLNTVRNMVYEFRQENRNGQIAPFFNAADVTAPQRPNRTTPKSETLAKKSKKKIRNSKRNRAQRSPSKRTVGN